MENKDECMMLRWFTFMKSRPRKEDRFIADIYIPNERQTQAPWNQWSDEK